jgi:GT2 family glycosyltransferase
MKRGDYFKKLGDHINLIENDRNYGFAEANNIVIMHVVKKSTPEYVLLLNNDTIIHPQFLDELVKVSEQDCSIGILAQRLISIALLTLV